MSERPPKPTAASSRPTPERILDAAEDCFARKGFEGTTLRDVAEIVGIRIPSLYNHFESKQALYAAVLERGISPILDLVTRSLATTEDDTSIDPRAFVEEVMGLLGARPNLPRLVQYELLAGGDHLAVVLEGWLRPTLERSLALMQETPAAAHWKPEQLPLLLIALLNVIVGHFSTTALLAQLLPNDPSTEQALANATELYGQVAALLTFGTAHESTAPHDAGSTSSLSLPPHQEPRS